MHSFIEINRKINYQRTCKHTIKAEMLYSSVRNAPGLNKNLKNHFNTQYNQSQGLTWNSGPNCFKNHRSCQMLETTRPHSSLTTTSSQVINSLRFADSVVSPPTSERCSSPSTSTCFPGRREEELSAGRQDSPGEGVRKKVGKIAGCPDSLILHGATTV